ncbi:MAG: Mur ligase family protein [Trueperaceae bacterium]
MPTLPPSYDDALAWLFARTRAGGGRGPARAAELLRDFEIPMPPLVVHVVGTNGKGTVTTMIAAGLTAAGHRTGRFVSPHVEEFRERIAIDGVPVPRRVVRAFVARAMRRTDAHPVEPDRQPAFFEWTLALALASFAQAGVTAAVLEAGVGGASDATRAVEPVHLVVLTNVDLDHVEAIGPTLDDIARDKAGAFRPGVQAVTGARGPSLARVRAEAERIGAPLAIDPRQGGDLGSVAATSGGGDTVDDDAARLFDLPGGTGLAQHGTRADDARLAAAAMRLLGLDERAVAAGVMAPPLPARGERFMVRGRDVVLDGAHDPAAGLRLADEVGDDYVLVFGALKRKAGSETLSALARKARHVVLTEAAAGEGVVRVPTSVRREPEVVLVPEDALATAIERCQRGGRVVIAGSLYLAGRLRPWLRRHGRPAAPLGMPDGGSGFLEAARDGAPATADRPPDLLDSRTA